MPSPFSKHHQVKSTLKGQENVEMGSHSAQALGAEAWV